MSRRFAFPLAAAAALALLVLPARAGAESAQPAPKSACSSRSVDNTTPQMQAFLKGLREVHAIGVPTLHQTSVANVQVQDFDITTADGTAVKVTVTCTAAGCISGCATTGCNPATYDGEPACTALVCKNGNTPCTIQGTCSKSVTQASGTASSSSGL